MQTDRFTPKSIGRFTLYDIENVEFVQCDTAIYPLTECCSAVATGTEWGTCCKDCYHEVDTAFGAVWTVGEQWETYLARFHEALNSKETNQ
jgi:hypothetical protein